MNDKRDFPTLQASTMAELLIVMLVAGTVFLMAFEGMDIIRRYSALVHYRFMHTTTLLYSHQTLESLMEESDSLRKEGQEILFYIREVQAKECRLVMDSAQVWLYRADHSEILFPELVRVDFHFPDKRTEQIDSIFIAVRSGKDTLQLSYGLSSLGGIQLNTYSE